MGKTAFLFSGQGAQRAGMGKEFYEHFTSVRALFDAAEELRPGTLQQMFAGSDDELRQTENTQPCLYLADLAAAYALRDSGLQPEAVAGFSLGEIPALAFAGAYDGMTGFRLACARGASMARAGKNVNASMAAIVKLPDETVERLCAAYDHVWPVNYNCDGQIAVSGDRDELERLYADVAAAGGRSMPLNVSGGFHSPYMDPASAEFGAILADTVLQKPALPAYANRTAEPYGENVRELLTQQINHPVRWKETLRHLNEQGFDTFVECGAGMVLCKLVRKNLPECRSFAVDSPCRSGKAAGGGNAVLLRDLIREYTQSRTELPPAPPARPVPQTHVCPKCKTESGRTAVEQGAMICPACGAYFRMNARERIMHTFDARELPGAGPRCDERRFSELPRLCRKAGKGPQNDGRERGRPVRNGRHRRHVLRDVCHGFQLYHGLHGLCRGREDHPPV